MVRHSLVLCLLWRLMSVMVEYVHVIKRILVLLIALSTELLYDVDDTTIVACVFELKLYY